MTQAEEIAVIDVETTGLFPGGHDRVIEVAVVRMKVDGTVLDEYVTLINPERDVGRTDIHGIRAGDVANAPPFASVVGDICSRLRGAVVAGHNVTFDCRFLESELARAGYLLPTINVLCTMNALGGRLADCCRDYGIELEQAHSALHDARATARLLTAWLAEREHDQDLALLAGGLVRAGQRLARRSALRHRRFARRCARAPDGQQHVLGATCRAFARCRGDRRTGRLWSLLQPARPSARRSARGCRGASRGRTPGCRVGTVRARSQGRSCCIHDAACRSGSCGRRGDGRGAARSRGGRNCARHRRRAPRGAPSGRDRKRL